jgi:hypothetical protein
MTETLDIYHIFNLHNRVYFVRQLDSSVFIAYQYHTLLFFLLQAALSTGAAYVQYYVLY